MTLGAVAYVLTGPPADRARQRHLGRCVPPRDRADPRVPLRGPRDRVAPLGLRGAFGLLGRGALGPACAGPSRAFPSGSPSFDRRVVLGSSRDTAAVVQVSGLLGMVLRSIEKVIAGTFIGVDTTALFDLGEKFPMMGTQIPGIDHGRPAPGLVPPRRAEPESRDRQALRQGRAIHERRRRDHDGVHDGLRRPASHGLDGTGPEVRPGRPDPRGVPRSRGR